MLQVLHPKLVIRKRLRKSDILLKVQNQVRLLLSYAILKLQNALLAEEQRMILQAKSVKAVMLKPNLSRQSKMTKRKRTRISKKKRRSRNPKIKRETKKIKKRKQVTQKRAVIGLPVILVSNMALQKGSLMEAMLGKVAAKNYMIVTTLLIFHLTLTT